MNILIIATMRTTSEALQQKSNVSVILTAGMHFSSLLVICDTMSSLATARVIGLVLLASPFNLVIS